MKDTHLQADDKKWAFDNEVTSNFESMLSQSIPSYLNMRNLCASLGKYFLPESDAHIIDLGASRGDSIYPFIEYSERNERNDKFTLYEVSEPMLSVLHERFESKPSVSILDKSIYADDSLCLHDSNSIDLLLSVLTLQFTPIEYRFHITDEIYRILKPGSAFIFVEKVIGANGTIDKALTELYLNLKSTNGYTKDQIDRKRKSLSGVLVPMTATYNEMMLKTSGFKAVDCFYRDLNFAGWIALK